VHVAPATDVDASHPPSGHLQREAREELRAAGPEARWRSFWRSMKWHKCSYEQLTRFVHSFEESFFSSTEYALPSLDTGLFGSPFRNGFVQSCATWSLDAARNHAWQASSPPYGHLQREARAELRAAGPEARWRSFWRMKWHKCSYEQLSVLHAPCLADEPSEFHDDNHDTPCAFSSCDFLKAVFR